MKTYRSANLDLPGIGHGFFSRQGGVSEGLYASLNCGPGSRDDAAAVARNRALAAQELGARHLVSLSQIHSAITHTIGPGWDFAVRPDGDAMATALPGVALGILTADCAPVLLADARARVVGAAHAGWKGALGGVVEAAIAAMEELGARRADIAAAIGPCISQANYEVGWEMRDQILARDGLRGRKFFQPSDKEGHYRFDLAAYAAHRLAQAGIGAVAGLGLCTYPLENGFFSFRRATHWGESDYGREISAILLTE